MSAIELDALGEMVRDRQGYTRISDIPQITQDVLWSVQLRQGEIPTNVTLGIGWLSLLELQADTKILSQKVQEFILTRAGVISCVAEAVIDGATRVATVTYRATISLTDLRRRTVLDDTVLVLI